MSLPNPILEESRWRSICCAIHFLRSSRPRPVTRIEFSVITGVEALPRVLVRAGSASCAQTHRDEFGWPQHSDLMAQCDRFQHRRGAGSSRTIRKYLPKLPAAPGESSRRDQRWTTFLKNPTDAVIACDLCAVASATFRILYVLVVMEAPASKRSMYPATTLPIGRRS
jgi:hypothetical protein